MSKQIAVIVDLDRRTVLGIASQDENGFRQVRVPDGHSVVVMTECSFSWHIVPNDAVELPAELPPETQPEGQGG